MIPGDARPLASELGGHATKLGGIVDATHGHLVKDHAGSILSLQALTAVFDRAGVVECAEQIRRNRRGPCLRAAWPRGR